MEDPSLEDTGNKELLDWARSCNKTESIIPHVLDEIALEGLDGITLQALRVRLKERQGMPVEITSKSMTQIWKILLKLKGLEIYELPEPRGNLILYRRRDYMDERGNLYEPLSAPEDLYLYSPVDAQGVRGSCPHFNRRKLIKDVHEKSLENVENEFGNRLVIVASQKLREQALLGPGSEGTSHMTVIQYCMLERIGRARYEGESTRGNVSLNTMKIDPKSLFYQRKYLMRKKMIKKQVFSMKFGKNRSTSLISILHLPRFYTPYVPVALESARKMIAYLRTRPHMREESADIKRKFGKTTYRTLLSKDFEKLFQETDVPLAELHPDVFAREKKAEKRESMLKRTQKALQFLNPPGDVESYLPNLKEQECRSGDAKGDANSFIKGIVYSSENHVFDTPLHRSQELICRSGTTGVTLGNISSYCKMYSLAARTGGRFSVRSKCARTSLVEKKKTKANKYIFNNVFPVPPPITSFPETDLLCPPRPKEKTSRKILKATVKIENQSLTAFVDSLMATPRGGNSNRDATGFSTNPECNSGEVAVVITSEMSEDSSRFRPVPVESEESEEGPIPSKRRRKEPIREPKERYARLFLGKLEGRHVPKSGKSLSFKKSKDGLYYDRKDLEALAKKNKQRVSWTAEEDQVIILLFISSVVFLPKYNLKKLFVFNAAQLRDMLHGISEESQHKTSLAIRRRLHFLMKNPTFRSKYTYYLHDAVRDELILKTFVAKFEAEVEPDPQKIFHSIPTESILEVYNYLMHKHGGELVQPRAPWPDDGEEIEFCDEPSFDAEAETDPDIKNSTCIVRDEADSVEFSDSPLVEMDKEQLSVEEIDCWAYDGSRKAMVDAARDPSSVEELETWICRTVVFSLMFSGDCVDDVQPFLERFGDEKLDFIASHCRKLNICSINRRSHKFGLSTNMRRRLANHLHPATYRGANDFLKKAQQDYRSAHPSVTGNSAAFFALVELLQGSKVDFDIFVSQDCTKESETGQAPFTINAMRKKKNQFGGEDDSASVTLPSIKIKICEEVEETLFAGIRLQSRENKEYLTELLFRVIPEDFVDNYVELCAHGDARAIKYARLYLTILQTEEIGISIRLLRSKFVGSSLKNGIIFLLSRGYIYSVGVTQRKFVAAKHIERWTMRVPSQNESHHRLHRVIVHPWITSTGRINWELVDRMLTAVLGVLCLHPGVQVLQIMRYLSPVISGFEVVLLLQAIIHFGFVDLYKVARTHEPQLFQGRIGLAIDNRVDPLMELEDLFIEPKPFATARYAQVQEMFECHKLHTPCEDSHTSEEVGASTIDSVDCDAVDEKG